MHFTQKVILSLNDRVCDAMKKLNSLRQQHQLKKITLNDLKTEYEQKCYDVDRAKATMAGISEEGKKLRELENRLAKARLKCQEAEHIKKTYEQIRNKLYEEHSSYAKCLDEQELQIKKIQKELANLRIVHKDAFLARDAIQKELRSLEAIVLNKRKQREQELTSVKKELDTKLAEDEKEKKLLSSAGDETAGPSQQPFLGLSEDQLGKITHYEELFKTIKEVAGVSDIDQIVERFESQGATQNHLNFLKTEAESSISTLRDERDKMLEDLEGLKYSGQLETTK
ncbi:hypothetical protein Ciccas_005505 [Cichlidogyrus casuarinus]|uniref:Uncharacterized protein n=1 Tax=Cichlidogyrus casuarinus TaxID=1844966 RepID=A0ABD2Q8G1_9PLAT